MISRKRLIGGRHDGQFVLHKHTVWIESFSERLRVPIWGGILAFTMAWYGLFVAALIAAESPMSGLYDLGLLSLVALMLVALPVPVYVRRKMESLETHALSMVENPKAAGDKIRLLSSLKPVLILAVGISSIFVLPYFLVPELELVASSVVVLVIGLTLLLLPYLLVVWVFTTALWTLGYSLLGVYRIGKLPMILRPFTLDRTLGLKPFASTCLHLTAVYYLLLLPLLISDLILLNVDPLPQTFVLIRDMGLVLLGLLLFLLPLSSLHEKLVRTKREKLSWINNRYSRIVHRIESDGDRPLDIGLQGELLGIDKIQRDIQTIRSWPFDMSSLTKLVTILLSLTAILLSRIIATILSI